MSVADEYRKALINSGELEKTAVDTSTKAQLDALAENKKLVEAEKQNAFRGAYVDYAKNINPYGVQSELAYGSGLGGAGKGETAQANYYNSYQNRLGEIDTTVTDQLRDIAQQESAARLASDQAKLSIDSSINQQLAAADREDALRQEQYDREDKANRYNQLLTAISSTGYMPTDAELAAAGMTRDMANSYKAAYHQQLAASYSSSQKSAKAMSTEDYQAMEDKIKSYVGADRGEEDAEAYLLNLLGFGYSNFSEDDAVRLLQRYFPVKGTRVVDGKIEVAKNGIWVPTGGLA